MVGRFVAPVAPLDFASHSRNYYPASFIYSPFNLHCPSTAYPDIDYISELALTIYVQCTTTAYCLPLILHQ